MSSDEEICGAELQTAEGICERPGTKIDGRCGYHSTAEQKNNYKHGLYQNRSGYYKDLPDADQEWIDAITDDLIDKSYFDEDDISAVEKLRQVSIDLHQRRRADEYIANAGMTQEKDIGFHEDYGMITQEEENTLMITKDRLSRESRMTLKDYGCLDEEHEGGGEESKSLVESLSEELE